MAQICTLLNDIWTHNRSYAEAHQYARAPGGATNTLTALKAQDAHAPQALTATPLLPQYMPQIFPPVIQTSPTLIPGARSRTKCNHFPSLSDVQDQGVEDRHTFKAARAKAHRDLDDDLHKRFQQNVPVSNSHPLFKCNVSKTILTTHKIPRFINPSIPQTTPHMGCLNT